MDGHIINGIINAKLKIIPETLKLRSEIHKGMKWNRIE